VRLATLLALAGLAGLAAGAAPGVAQDAPTQDAPPLEQPADAGDPLTVYLMTMGPGELVWERFGHNAIWIHDARTGEDVVWNWGLFSFSQAGFIPRLVRGEMMYAMGGFRLDSTLAEYADAGRAVWVQQLRLTPAQSAELDRLIRLNAEPENRFYRYDYYLDNCSTRVRDLLDAVLGGSLRAAYEPLPTGTTWRWHTLRLLDEARWPRTGVQLVLGNPGDESIDRWQEMFLPMKVRAAVAELTVPDAEGRPLPLVVREMQLLEARSAAPPAEPRSRVVAFLLAGLLAGAALAGLAALAAARGGAPLRWLAGLAVALWGALGGVVGMVLVGAYLTDHHFWYANENLLQASPLHLVVGAAGLLLLVRRSAPAWGVRVARWAAALSLLGLVVKPLPLFDQGNLEIVALALPLNLAAAWALARLARPSAPDAGARAAELRPAA
jgi:hypothetical protein